MNKDKDLDEKRKKVITVLISCLIAIAFGRLLARLLPFRQRPVLDSLLTFLYPDPHIADGLHLKSSMSSDHAVMFLALVTGIFLISKRIGLITFIYVSCFVFLPRIYLGLHYPTDILVGGLLGVVITLIISNIRITDQISQRILNFSTKYSEIFYVLFFWLSFQIGTMFDSSRAIEHYLLTLFLRGF
ncbi:MAG: phosphatase PAP2 family protein [Bacteroidia bacterium]